MPSEHLPPNLTDFLMVLVLSTVSACIAIGRRIVSGHNPNVLWFITEFLTAVLCGYLMWTAYPGIVDYLPSWITEPVAIAIAAHSGGRVMQACYNMVLSYIEKVFIKL